MIPPKLKRGDTLRIVSPAISLAPIPQDQRELATERLTQLGLSLSYGTHAEAQDRFNSSPVAARLADLHAAFADPSVQGILTTLGGYNSNQLLDGLDYELIRAHPKILCGYSDITALTHAIYARSGLVTYAGPHFTTFAMRHGLDYTLHYFERCLMQAGPYLVEPAQTWSDDAWYQDQEARTFIPNPGPLVIQEGRAEGILLGGNLSTFILLHGTPYLPSLEGSILLLEDDEEITLAHFDRFLQALLHQPGFAGVRGLIIGRFQRASQVEMEDLKAALRSKAALADIPIIVRADFGHTTPQFTYPVGGRGTLEARSETVRFHITAH